MVAPKPISRRRFVEFPGVRWNAFNEICFSDIAELTAVQRRAHLISLYSSEVYNGGHYQYFVNKSHWDHVEVIRALNEIGATDYATNLAAALNDVNASPIAWPESVGQFLAGQTDHDLTLYDKAFFKCSRKIEAWLKDYLDRYEYEFVVWIP
jgi:hypothetical protein